MVWAKIKHRYIIEGHALFQGIFPIQGSNLGLLHCMQSLYYLTHQGSTLKLRGGGVGVYIFP